MPLLSNFLELSFPEQVALSESIMPAPKRSLYTRNARNTPLPVAVAPRAPLKLAAGGQQEQLVPAADEVGPAQLTDAEVEEPISEESGEAGALFRAQARWGLLCPAPSVQATGTFKGGMCFDEDLLLHMAQHEGLLEQGRKLLAERRAATTPGNDDGLAEDFAQEVQFVENNFDERVKPVSKNWYGAAYADLADAYSAGVAIDLTEVAETLNIPMAKMTPPTGAFDKGVLRQIDAAEPIYSRLTFLGAWKPAPPPGDGEECAEINHHRVSLEIATTQFVERARELLPRTARQSTRAG